LTWNGTAPIGAIESVRQLIPMTSGKRQLIAAGEAPAVNRASRSPAIASQPASPGVSAAFAGTAAPQERGTAAATASGKPDAAREQGRPSEPGRTILPQPPQPASKPTGRPSEPQPSSANVRMVLYDLQSGIRKAEVLLQSVSTELSASSTRLLVAKAYSLEMQAQQEINRLHTEIGAANRVWFA